MIKHGGVTGYPDARHIAEGGSVLEEECDILIPAALEGVINLQNADRIKAPLIIEAANGPITASVDDILREKGVAIIPDMYANVGGVTVSCFEWAKNLSHIRFDRMQGRREEARHQLVIAELEQLIAHMGNGWTLILGFKQKYLRGAGELDWCARGSMTRCALRISRC